MRSLAGYVRQALAVKKLQFNSSQEEVGSVGMNTIVLVNTLGNEDSNVLRTSQLRVKYKRLPFVEKHRKE